jgi:hypothetical protein
MELTVLSGISESCPDSLCDRDVTVTRQPVQARSSPFKSVQVR